MRCHVSGAHKADGAQKDQQGAQCKSVPVDTLVIAGYEERNDRDYADDDESPAKDLADRGDHHGLFKKKQIT